MIVYLTQQVQGDSKHSRAVKYETCCEQYIASPVASQGLYTQGADNVPSRAVARTLLLPTLMGKRLEDNAGCDWCPVQRTLLVSATYTRRLEKRQIGAPYKRRALHDNLLWWMTYEAYHYQNQGLCSPGKT